MFGSLVADSLFIYLFLIQGIMHTEKPIFTAQFHPEAFGGPTDTEVILEGTQGYRLVDIWWLSK